MHFIQVEDCLLVVEQHDDNFEAWDYTYKEAPTIQDPFDRLDFKLVSRRIVSA